MSTTTTCVYGLYESETEFPEEVHDRVLVAHVSPTKKKQQLPPPLKEFQELKCKRVLFVEPNTGDKTWKIYGDSAQPPKENKKTKPKTPSPPPPTSTHAYLTRHSLKTLT